MNCKQTFRQLALALAVAAATASPSFAATYGLSAGTATITVAGQSVPVWGFACTSTTVAATCPSLGTVTVPGPVLVVPPGEDLIINLTNNLPEAVSVIIPGQALPAVTGGIAQGAITDTQGRQRLTSFTAQAAASGGTATFTWISPNPGSYLYQSGSHVTQQVQMGLYGALTKDAAAGQAYPGVAYDTQVILLYSEIDPALHDPVALPANAINYKPSYFLVNGQPFAAGDPPVASVTSDQRVLLRFLNAGLNTHVPALQGAYISVIAEDGKPYPYPREQYSVMLAAGKTQDAIFNPTAGTFAVWDRSLHLSNAGAAGGGMFSTIQVDAAGGAPVAVADAYPATEDTTLDTTASSLNGVLFNDSGSPTTASLVAGTTAGALTLNADGSFTYIPNANFNGTDSFTYRAFAGVVGSNVATVTITVAPVNDAAAAAADAYVTDQGVLLTVAAPGVLGNDSDVDADPLTAVKLTDPTSGTLTWSLSNDGSFTYTNSTPGTYTFDYAANDGTVNSPPAIVTITVNAKVNQAPIAVDDFNTTRTTTPVTINVLGNDYDPDGDALNPASVTIVARPNRGGTVTVDASTGVVTYTAKKNFRGTDTFAYTMKDIFGATSKAAFVKINVVR
jgi:FtsP/CotA-like multicopper oxidase with cupredoxin domain